MGEHRGSSAPIDSALASLAEGALPELPYELRTAVAAWLCLGRESGYFHAGVAPSQRLPTDPDVGHSTLLTRLVEGEPVFHYAPPIQHSYPWVEFIRDRGARMHLLKGIEVVRESPHEPGIRYLELAGAPFLITHIDIEGWIHATQGRWNIRARQVNSSAEDAAPTDSLKPKGTISGEGDDPEYILWEVQVLNPEEECAQFGNIDSILQKFGIEIPRALA